MTEHHPRRYELTQKIAALKDEIAQAQQELAKLDTMSQAEIAAAAKESDVVAASREASFLLLETAAAASKASSPYAARNRYGRIESGSRA